MDPIACRLVLASASPRRAHLMREAGLKFEVVAAGIAEPKLPHLSPRELALWLARQKAVHVASQRPRALVVAADTVVALGNEIFGKPGTLRDAARMLERLSGRSHLVHTGVWIEGRAAGCAQGFTDTSEVVFRKLGRTQIGEYLASIHPLDKAGGYAAQEEGQKIIRRIRGSRSNVIGLPMEKLLPALQDVMRC